jgi:hypothetical protein
MMLQLTTKEELMPIFEAGKFYDLPEKDWDMIFPSEYNVRKTDIEGTIEWDELYASMRRDWVEDHLEITPDGAIWDGQRRFALARQIVAEEKIESEESGKDRPERCLPLRCRDLTPEEQIKRSLNKNLLRKDVGAHDVAESLSDLIGILETQNAVAEFLGQSPAWISERIAVLSTPQRKYDKKEQKVVTDKKKTPNLKDVPKGKVSSVADLLATIDGTSDEKEDVAKKVSKLPRDQIKDLKDEVKKTTAKGDVVSSDKVQEKIEEKEEVVKRTVNRTFRLQREINDFLKVAEGRGYIEDQHEFVNDALRNGLRDVGMQV